MADSTDSTGTPKKERSEAQQATVANLKPWVKGTSGNPGGRKKLLITEAYDELLTKQVPNDPEGRSYAQVLAQSMMRRAIAGNVRAVMEVTDRVEGKPRQAVDMNHSGSLEVSTDDKRAKLAARLAALSAPEDDAASETSTFVEPAG